MSVKGFLRAYSHEARHALSRRGHSENVIGSLSVWIEIERWCETNIERPDVGGSSRARLKPFRENLARFSDEEKKFALGDPHDVDILMRRLAGHQVCDIFAGDEQRAR